MSLHLTKWCTRNVQKNLPTCEVWHPKGELFGQSWPILEVTFSKAHSINMPNFVPFWQPMCKTSAAKLSWFCWQCHQQTNKKPVNDKVFAYRVATVSIVVKLQGSVAMQSRRGGIVNDHFTKNLLPSHKPYIYSFTQNGSFSSSDKFGQCSKIHPHIPLTRTSFSGHRVPAVQCRCKWCGVPSLTSQLVAQKSIFSGWCQCLDFPSCLYTVGLAKRKDIWSFGGTWPKLD